MSEMTIVSPLTGIVSRVILKEGDNFSAGDEIVVLESMKMQFPVPAEADGTFGRYLVDEGDEVAEGQPIATFVPRVS